MNSVSHLDRDPVTTPPFPVSLALALSLRGWVRVPDTDPRVIHARDHFGAKARTVVFINAAGEWRGFVLRSDPRGRTTTEEF